jgi:hypothetical protein
MKGDIRNEALVEGDFAWIIADFLHREAWGDDLTAAYMSYTTFWNEHAGRLQKRYTLYSKVFTFHSSCNLYIEIDFRKGKARKRGKERILRRCLPLRLKLPGVSTNPSLRIH